MLYRITLGLYGKQFDAKTFIAKLSEPVNVISHISPGDKSDIEGKPTYDFGSASIQHPSIEFDEYFVSDDYPQWYVDFAQRTLTDLDSVGIERASLLTDIYYDHQCNFEMFTSEMLRQIGTLKIVLTYSVYHVHESELQIMEEAYD